MAKIQNWNKKPQTKVAAIENEITPTANEPVEQVKPQKTTNEISLNDIMAEIEALKAENKKLQKVNQFKEAKKINDDPKQFSYKIRGWLPVLSYTSKRKDITKDWTFKNQFGTIESNHLLVLNLADGSTTEVEITDFNANFTRSEKEEAKVVDGDGMIVKDFSKLINYGGVENTSYVFDHPTYWEITVLYSAIN